MNIKFNKVLILFLLTCVVACGNDNDVIHNPGDLKYYLKIERSQIDELVAYVEKDANHYGMSNRQDESGLFSGVTGKEILMIYFKDSSVRNIMKVHEDEKCSDTERACFYIIFYINKQDSKHEVLGYFKKNFRTLLKKNFDNIEIEQIEGQNLISLK